MTIYLATIFQLLGLFILGVVYNTEYNGELSFMLQWFCESLFMKNLTKNGRCSKPGTELEDLKIFCKKNLSHFQKENCSGGWVFWFFLQSR